MGRVRAVAAVAAALVAGALLQPSGAAAAAVPGSVLLTLTPRPGAAAELHRLARTPVGRAHHAARLQALAALAPGADRRQAVESWARSHHLRVLRADDWSVSLAGPSGDLASLLGGQVVPSALRGDVSAVHGLGERVVMHPHAVPLGMTGDGLRTRYGVPLTGWTGAGVTVGTLNLAGWNPQDLTDYASAAGIPVPPGQISTVQVDSPPNPLVPDGSGGDFEVAMDAEAILAAAPQAKQRMYFAPNNGVGTVDVFNQMAADGAAGLLQVASTSWGLCEPDTPSWYRDQVGQAVDRMLAAGVTLFAASGDAGMYDCSTSTAVDNRAAVDFPASYPGVVAVGGTRAGSPETAWGNVSPSPGTAYAGDGGGGGASSTYPRPAYQSGLAQPGTTRLVPDVSSVADPGTGLGIVNQGHWWLGGGTSVAAPTWAGFTAAALAGAGRTTGLGDIHPLIYQHPEAFTDVTAGSNGYPAAPGFDLATGLGTPQWAALGAILAGAPTPPRDTTPPTTTATAALLTGTDTRVLLTWGGHDPAPSSGLASYTLALTQVGGGTVWSATTSSTSATLALAAGRAYVLTARAQDAAGNVGPATTARVAVPYDDTSLARSGSWSRLTWGADYRGSHLTSARRGSALALAVTGRTVALGLVKARNGGYVDVYVDGRRTARLDTYSATTQARQPVRVAAWPTSGRHTVRLVVVGGHRAGASGSWVRVDSATVAPW